MPLETLSFDAAEYLSQEGETMLLTDAASTGEVTYIRHALDTVARARGMAQIAREAGMTREALYRALGADGHPDMTAVLGVFCALGIKVPTTAPAAAE